MIRFLLFLAGFKRDVINNLKMDKFHAIAIGCIMLFVGIYATLAWFLFFHTAFNLEWKAALPLGLLFGYFIVCFDRALIASMVVQYKKSGIVFRFGFAILLGIFLSQPVILKIYQQEVGRRAELLIGDENTKKQEELDAQYESRISEYQKEIDRCDTVVHKAKQYYEDKTKVFQDEYKGTGGSGLVGYNIRAQKDEGIMNEAKREYDDICKEYNPKRQQYKDSISVLEQKKETAYNKFAADNQNTGLIMQEKALMKLMQEDDTRTFFGIKSLWFRYCILSIILALIELSALIVKLFFPFKSYKKEIEFITDTEVETSENKKEIFKENQKNTTMELKKSFAKHIADFFRKTEPVTELKLDEMINEWKQEKDKPLWEFYQLVMDKLLIQGIKLDTEPKVSSQNDYTPYLWMIPFIVVCIIIAIPFVPKEYEFHFSSILSVIGLCIPYIFQKIKSNNNINK